MRASYGAHEGDEYLHDLGREACACGCDVEFYKVNGLSYRGPWRAYCAECQWDDTDLEEGLGATPRQALADWYEQLQAAEEWQVEQERRVATKSEERA